MMKTISHYAHLGSIPILSWELCYVKLCYCCEQSISDWLMK